MELDQITNVGQLRLILDDYQDETPILSQVVGEKSGAWNMLLYLADGKKCGFEWKINPVVFQMKHPSIETLPKLEKKTEQKEVI